MKRKLVLIAGMFNAALGAMLIAFTIGKMDWRYLFLIGGIAATAYAMKWPGDEKKD